MAAGQSLSEQLRALSDPRPADFHPDQEDWDLLTGATLSQSRTYSDVGRSAEKGGVSTRRSRASSRKRLAELEDDSRYAGKPISRKELGYEQSGNEFESEEKDQSDDELESGDQLEGSSNDVTSDHSEDNDQSVSSVESEEEEEVEREGEVEQSGFSAISMDLAQQDLEKGRAVREQIKLWDGVLEGRIKLHKSLCLANSLPQPPHMPAFLGAGGERATTSREQVLKELTSLLDSLLRLQHNLLLRHKDTRSLVNNGTSHHTEGSAEVGSVGGSDEEVPSDVGSNEESSDMGEEEEEERGSSRKRRQRKRKCPWRVCGYEEYISTQHAAFVGYRDETIAKWDAKLRLASGKLTNKAFVQVDRSTLAQIKHVLEDKARLVKRTQLKRSVYRVLGKEEGNVGEEVSHDSHLKSHDEEIYDEDDFYHQLLRNLIERKMNYSETADPVAMGRQWLALQKLRSKVKKKVDTKASKGRKIRYDVHPKLVGFMPPIDRGGMADSSRNDLFLSLFGARCDVHKDDLQ